MSMSVPEPMSLASKMWRSSFKVALGIHLFFVLYIFLYDGRYDFVSFVKTFAGTANILLALSLSLSSFGYPVRWRQLLRLGYLAFFLLVVRAILNQALPVGADGIPEMWLVYLDNPDHLPPPRLLFSLVALTVIAFRLLVEFDKYRQGRKRAV